MVSIRWCLNARNGIELVEPSENMAESYMKMAEESLHVIPKNEESRIWTASTSYYTMYYSLYAVLMKFGIKCEIHQCSIEFMKQFLNEFYDESYFELIKNAFKIRNDLQYYPDKLTDNLKLGIVKKGAVVFFVKSKEILLKLGEKQIKEIRKKIKEKKDENTKK